MMRIKRVVLLLLLALCLPTFAFAADASVLGELMGQIEMNVLASPDSVGGAGIALLGAAMLLTSIWTRPQKRKKKTGGKAAR